MRRATQSLSHAFMQKPLRRSATHARGGATTTSCGVAVAFVLGLGLIATGIQLTTHQAGAAPMDGAHFLRQARYVPSQREAAAEPRLDGARRSTAEPQQRAPHGANGITRVEGTLTDNPAFQAAMAGTAATTTTNAAHSPVISKGACLVTKWSAVWLVHADKRTRSHISAPTVSCDLHASEVDDIEQYAKAHGGAGAYVLGEADSKLACEMPGCTPKVAAEGEAGGAGADARAPPANGWGAGVAAGWPERSALKFNEPASEGFARSPPPPGEPLLLVFGGASVNDMLRNWAIHARRLGMGYVVACMDQQLFDLAASKAIPAVMMKDKVGGGAGGDGAVTTRWKYYRMDPKAFMQMGILKVRFFMEFLRGGFDLLCSDLDVVWLRSPLPYLAGEAGTALLPLADVVVSTDVTHGGADNDRELWGMHGELNTGIILLRSTFRVARPVRRVDPPHAARDGQHAAAVGRLPPVVVQRPDVLQRGRASRHSRSRSWASPSSRPFAAAQAARGRRSAGRRPSARIDGGVVDAAWDGGDAPRSRRRRPPRLRRPPPRTAAPPARAAERPVQAPDVPRLRRAVHRPDHRDAALPLLRIGPHLLHAVAAGAARLPARLCAHDLPVWRHRRVHVGQALAPAREAAVVRR